jgi:hypothetical protein
VACEESAQADSQVSTTTVDEIADVRGVWFRFFPCLLEVSYAALLAIDLHVETSMKYAPGPPGWAKISTWLSDAALIFTASFGPAKMTLMSG